MDLKELKKKYEKKFSEYFVRFDPEAFEPIIVKDKEYEIIWNFIESAVKDERKRIVEEIEGMKEYYCGEPGCCPPKELIRIKTKNEAIDNILQKLK